MRSRLLTVLSFMSLSACAPGVTHDVVIRHGTIYDGSGASPVRGGVAITGDRIAAVGDLAAARGQIEIDAAASPSRPASSTC